MRVRPIVGMALVLLELATLGAATTAGSAVLLALRTPSASFERSSDDCCADWAAMHMRAIYAVSAAKTRSYSGFLIELPMAQVDTPFQLREWGTPIETFLLPEALAYANQYWRSPQEALRVVRLVEYYGWPRLAAYTVSDLSFPYGKGVQVSATTGWCVDRFSHKRPFYNLAFPAVIPRQVLWRGFAFNAAVYAMGWSVLIALMLAGYREVRRFRLARGRCVQCGYSLTGLAAGVRCPECGRGVT